MFSSEAANLNKQRSQRDLGIGDTQNKKSSRPRRNTSDSKVPNPSPPQQAKGKNLNGSASQDLPKHQGLSLSKVKQLARRNKLGESHRRKRQPSLPPKSQIEENAAPPDNSKDTRQKRTPLAENQCIPVRRRLPLLQSESPVEESNFIPAEYGTIIFNGEKEAPPQNPQHSPNNTRPVEDTISKKENSRISSVHVELSPNDYANYFNLRFTTEEGEEVQITPTPSNYLLPPGYVPNKPETQNQPASSYPSILSSYSTRPPEENFNKEKEERQRTPTSPNYILPWGYVPNKPETQNQPASSSPSILSSYSTRPPEENFNKEKEERQRTPTSPNYILPPGYPRKPEPANQLASSRSSTPSSYSTCPSEENFNGEKEEGQRTPASSNDSLPSYPRNEPANQLASSESSDASTSTSSSDDSRTISLTPEQISERIKEIHSELIDEIENARIRELKQKGDSGKKPIVFTKYGIIRAGKLIGKGNSKKVYEIVGKPELVLIVLNQNTEENEILAINALSEGKATRVNNARANLTDSGDKVYIIAPKYPSNLNKELESNLSIPQKYKYSLEALYAVKEFHKKFLHRDIKPDNFLLRHDKKLVLNDFGTSYNLKTGAGKDIKCFYIPTLDPCFITTYLEKEFDVYQLGLMMLLIHTNRPIEKFCKHQRKKAGTSEAERTSNPAEYFSKLSKWKSKPEQWVIWNKIEDRELKAFIKLMISPDPSKRPTIDEAIIFFEGKYKSILRKRKVNFEISEE